MSESGQLDAAAIGRLLRLGGHAFVAKMISLFGAYGAEKLKAADEARKAGNWFGVADAVHPIKSSAGNVGAKRVQSLAQQLEDAARASGGNELEPLLTELHIAFEAAMAELEAIRATHQTAAAAAK